MSLPSLVALLLVICNLSHNACAYFIHVDSHGSECFYQRATAGAKMQLVFEVADGGFLDIDVKVVGPEDKVMYKREQETSGRYQLAAYMDGSYKYCFSNFASSQAPKIVKFTFDVDEPKKPVAKETLDKEAEEQDKLGEMIVQLTQQLRGVKQEQAYMEVRDRVHRSISDSTNSRVVWWAFFESLILVAMTGGQVFYLKRFFEVRRVI